MIRRKKGEKNKIFILVFLLLLKPILAWPNSFLKARYDPIIQSLARTYGVPAELIHSVIKIESNYNERAVSPKGAMGLMQLMPETAKFYGVNDPFNPEENIKGGILYLKDLIRLYNGQTKYVLAAYNAGQEALKKYNGIPPYKETKDYIQKVMALYSRPYIPSGLPIYRFQDESGKTILTNDPLLRFNIQRKNNQ
ncbi:MAG: lytic transglycosylase domain-containing protein [Candidatus Aminicenantes bacterium]|nr:lytic transglycosylase domain-containing protein [Candidatus Aminicenantes bacterium]